MKNENKRKMAYGASGGLMIGSGIYAGKAGVIGREANEVGKNIGSLSKLRDNRKSEAEYLANEYAKLKKAPSFLHRKSFGYEREVARLNDTIGRYRGKYKEADGISDISRRKSNLERIGSQIDKALDEVERAEYKLKLVNKKRKEIVDKNSKKVKELYSKHFDATDDMEKLTKRINGLSKVFNDITKGKSKQIKRAKITGGLALLPLGYAVLNKTGDRE